MSDQQAGPVKPKSQRDEPIANATSSSQSDSDGTANSGAVSYPQPSMGLVNQGCTCYLNSLLQLLFHVSYFRAAVYGITLGDSDESAIIPKALQELFFQMQERRTAPTTKGLTDAFGWDEREVFVQHDIQEMLTLLRDCLESKMRGTPSEGSLSRLFEGHGESVVETLDRSYTSRQKDTFYDVHLPIQNFSSIEESLRSLTQKDQLVGDNKYRVEEDGKPVVYKDAEKGYRFVQFPPTVFFHLKRFEMDFMSPTLDMKKINSAFEFSETLDLREFETGKGSKESNAAAKDVIFDRDSQAIYDLNGVIVHRGTARSGHYYCYIRHFDAEKQRFTHWLEYDDDVVRVVDKEIAVDANFGGSRYVMIHGRQVLMPNTNNAYILSYVRRADCAKVLSPVPTDVIPDHVKRELRRVMEVDERRAATEKIRRQQVRIVLATDEAINSCVRKSVVDLLPREERTNPDHCKFWIDAKKLAPYSSLFELVSEVLGKDQYPQSSFRLWRWNLNADKALYRPLIPLPTLEECSAEATIATAILTQAVQERDAMAHVLLYVERNADQPAKKLLCAQVSSGTAVRVFVKMFQPRDRSLSFLGPLDMERGVPVVEYLKPIAAMMNLPAASVDEKSVALYLEGGRQYDTHHITMQRTVSQCGITSGAILVIQATAVSLAYRCQSVPDVIKEGRSRRVLQVRDVKAPDDVVGEVTVLDNFDYDMICEGIHRLVVKRCANPPPSPMYLQLHRNADLYTPTPNETPARSSACSTVWDLCNVNGYHTSVIFYGVLSHSRLLAESVMQFRVRLFSSCGGGAIKDVQISVTAPFVWQDIVRAAVAAPPIEPAPSTSSPKPPGDANNPTLASSSNEDESTGDGGHTSPASSPNTVVQLAAHYVAIFAFESRSRPSRVPVDISMAPDAEPRELGRTLCPSEWIFLYPNPPITERKSARDWTAMSSDDESTGDATKTVSSSSAMARTPTQMRICVTQGEFVSGNYAVLFGVPFFVTVDVAHSTIEDVILSALDILHIPKDSEDLLADPVMLVVEESLADGETISGDRDVDAHCNRSRHYRFTDLRAHIYQFLRHHGERFFLYVNRRRPKEKPGSRYVAMNDPKLIIEKKKTTNVSQS